MVKEQIAVHSQPVKPAEQGIQSTPPAPPMAVMPVSQPRTPPIVESTIIIQAPPLPDDDADPITISQSIQGAFTTQLESGEALIQPTCVLKTTTDKNVGDEASQVQVALSETCQAAAYDQADLQHMVSHLVSQQATQRYGPGYALAGDVNVNLQDTAISPPSQQIATMHVNAVSTWVYQFGKSQQQQFTHVLAGKERVQALRLLSHLDGIQRATVLLAGGYNDTLPQDQGRIQIVIVYRVV